MHTPAPSTGSNRPGRCTLPAVLSACVVSAALLTSAAAWAAGPASPPSAARQAIPVSLLAEIEVQAKRLGLGNAQLQSLLASLRAMDMSQLRDLGMAKNASQLERLIPGIGNMNQPVVFDPTRPGAGAGGGSGLQQGVQGQLTIGPGQMSTGRTGQLSAAPVTCQACQGKTGGPFAGSVGTGQNPNQDPDATWPKQRSTANGGTITIYEDRSAVVQNGNGTTEYFNSERQLVDKNGATKEPLPDSQARSNRITVLDLIAIQARLGSKGEPNPNRDGGGGGTGGGVDAGKANPVGSRATFIEGGGTARVSVAALQEVIRIAVEKLGGPIGPR